MEKESNRLGGWHRREGGMGRRGRGRWCGESGGGRGGGGGEEREGGGIGGGGRGGREAGVRDLHFGVHGAAEGSDEHAWRDQQSAAMDAGDVCAGRKRPGVAEDTVQFRCIGVGGFLAADVWGAAGGGAAGGASGQRGSGGSDRAGRGDNGALCAVDAGSVRGGEGAGGAGREPAPGDLQRRSSGAGAVGECASAAGGSRSLQPVRAYGSSGGCDELEV